MKTNLCLFFAAIFQLCFHDFASAQKPDDAPVFTVVEEMPIFPGGETARLKFLQDNINYPKEAKEKGIQGTVYITFVVGVDGKIENVRVLRGIGGGCDEESVRVISIMPRWQAGKQAGKAVRVQFTMPIRYTLANDSISKKTGFNLSLDFYLALSGVNFDNKNSPSTTGKYRFTGFPNLEFCFNLIHRKNLALYSGLTFANMGISVKDSVTHKYRYLSIGIPLGFRYFFMGHKNCIDICAGVDFPYHFKVKDYFDSGKKKSSEFFSKQVNPVQPYFCFGVGNGLLQIRFKYFISEFFNTSYSKDVNGISVKPYSGITASPYEFGLVFGRWF